MTASPAGNVRLRAARQQRGLVSQRAFVEAVAAAARTAGLGELSLSTRTVRRWETENPAWPRLHHAQALEALFETNLENLGFTRPRSSPPPATFKDQRLHQPPADTAPPLRFSGPLDQGILDSYRDLTAAYRQLFGPLPGSALESTVTEHARLGSRLLTSPSSEHHRALAGQVCDAWLLSARIRLFDTIDLSVARAHLHHALAAAQTAEDDARAAAVLAHSALAIALTPTATDGPEPHEIIRIARTFAARCTENAPLLMAWLDTAEADIELRTGDPAAAAPLVAHAEQLCKTGTEPKWLDWLHPHQVATLKADVLLSLERDAEAVSVVQRIVHGATNPKHRALAYADLAAIAAAHGNPELACDHLHDALDALDGAWHESVETRIRQVRNQLEPWSNDPGPRAVDERLYTWVTALEVASR